MKKLSNTEAELKKSVASKKALKYNILKDDYQKNKDVVIAYARYFLYFSSNVNEVIRAVLNFLFFTKKFHTHKKHKKHISKQK